MTEQTWKPCIYCQNILTAVIITPAAMAGTTGPKTLSGTIPTQMRIKLRG